MASDKLKAAQKTQTPPAPTKYKIVFLGDQSVGKTSIITRFMFDNFPQKDYEVKPQSQSRHSSLCGPGHSALVVPTTLPLHPASPRELRSIQID